MISHIISLSAFFIVSASLSTFAQSSSANGGHTEKWIHKGQVISRVVRDEPVAVPAKRATTLPASLHVAMTGNTGTIWFGDVSSKGDTTDRTSEYEARYFDFDQDLFGYDATMNLSVLRLTYIVDEGNF